MRRREFITLLGGATALPLSARAPQPAMGSEGGFFYSGAQAAAGSRVEEIISGLRAGGYPAPTQVELVVRAAEGDPTRIASLTDEIIAQDVDVFIANGPSVLNAAHRATRTIPIVALDLETDPVANGLAAALARPGGNVTGVFLDFPDFTTKWIELLVECNPKLSRIAVLWDPTTGSVQMESVKKAAELLKLQLDIFRGANRV